MEDKIWSVDLNDDETYYIVKFSASSTGDSKSG